MTASPELMRAMFPLAARHRAVALTRAVLHWATFPAVFAASLVAALAVADDDLDGR